MIQPTRLRGLEVRAPWAGASPTGQLSRSRRLVPEGGQPLMDVTHWARQPGFSMSMSTFSRSICRNQTRSLLQNHGFPENGQLQYFVSPRRRLFTQADLCRQRTVYRRFPDRTTVTKWRGRAKLTGNIGMCQGLADDQTGVSGDGAG